MYFTTETTVEEKKMSINKHFGDRIRTIRKACSMTQEQFVDALEIKGGKSLISQVENGKRTLPANVLPIIAEQGETTVESLFRDDVMVVDSMFADLLLKMNVSDADSSKIMFYMDGLVKNAKNNLGSGRLFDLLYCVLKTASATKNGENLAPILSDSLYQIEFYDYSDDSSSKYLNYVKHLSGCSE